MRILLVCENYLPHYGGAEVVFKNIAEGFAKTGNKVDLVTRRLPGTKKFEIINDVHVHRVRSFNTRYLFSFTAIPTVLRLAKEADIIQTTTFNGAPPAWIAARVRKKKVVLTVHEVWVGKWKQVTDLNIISCWIHNFLERMIYTITFDHYICVSNATKNDLLQSQTKIAKENVTTIHNGMDYDFWNPKQFDGGKVREKLSLEGRFICFAWGRPGISKGLEYAIKAMSTICAKIPKAVLLLMLGSPQSYKKRTKYLQDLVSKSNGNIIILESIPYAELGDYIAVADCVLVPSIAEGFGYNAVEACTMGKPVVASDVGSLPEVVSGKFTLVPPKNSEAIAEAVVKASKGEFTKTPLKRFSWEKARKEYLQVYNRLLGEHSSTQN